MSAADEILRLVDEMRGLMVEADSILGLIVHRGLSDENRREGEELKWKLRNSYEKTPQAIRASLQKLLERCVR